MVVAEESRSRERAMRFWDGGTAIQGRSLISSSGHRTKKTVGSVRDSVQGP